MTDITENLALIRKRIETAALRSGRDPQSVRLVAVSKRKERPLIEQAIAAGQMIFGENYLQEAKEKIEQVQGSAQWHFIGHIQSNKAKDVAALFDTVHTVDRLKIARALDKYAGLAGRTLSVLVQVNVGEEPQKAGALPKDAEELVKEAQKLAHIRVMGLMTMPPFLSDPEKVRPYFRELHDLAEQFASKGYFHNNERFELSMGMSGDFEVAIEEGATLVRVGTAIFGERPPLVHP